ncbi:GntR family transcriptional regulator [Novosphingobium resinovorum]|uniref:HTH gntR-type domain-containing protein n=1 Tax=Novosphingobium resinovorum TaxID=158500 RepID=A0A1D8A6M6_9SPHN|nr:FCD domain-containing protein [Novosphingobium resinovorum]AOR77767.1 hypothetical protein BES08_14145 [Novosphingobium resinovorum]
MSPDRDARRTLISYVYHELRAMIIDGVAIPGSKLHIVELSKRFNVSPSATREALSKLAAERLVELEEQRGFRVAGVSVRELRDITFVRVQIEQLALRRAVELGDTEWEAGVVAAFHRLVKTKYFDDEAAGEGKEDWSARHRDFHRALIAACDSEWLLRFHDNLFDQSERYRRLNRIYQNAEMAGLRRDVLAEHKTLTEAALDRDADRLCTVIAQHLNGTAERVIAKQSANLAASASVADKEARTRRRTTPAAKDRVTSR